MKPDEHSLLSQLVQLGLESLAAKASAALNGIAVDVPERGDSAPDAASDGQNIPSGNIPDDSPNPDQQQEKACEINTEAAQ